MGHNEIRITDRFQRIVEGIHLGAVEGILFESRRKDGITGWAAKASGALLEKSDTTGDSRQWSRSLVLSVVFREVAVADRADDPCPFLVNLQVDKRRFVVELTPCLKAFSIREMKRRGAT